MKEGIHPNYQFVAARLLLFAVRKQLYGKMKELPTLEQHIYACVNSEVYDNDIFNKYSIEDIQRIGESFGYIYQMIDDLEISEVINRVRYSGLSFSSRQLIYSRLINEIWSFNSHELKYNVGIDDAFDSVYLNSNDINYDEDYSGC